MFNIQISFKIQLKISYTIERGMFFSVQWLVLIVKQITLWNSVSIYVCLVNKFNYNMIIIISSYIKLTKDI